MLDSLPPVYIAGPFAADTHDEIKANVGQAVALSLHAVRCGMAPICVHPGILAGAYGDDDAPEDRERGLNVCEALVDLVAAHPRGEFWAILRLNGSMSTGTNREYGRYMWRRGQIALEPLVTVRTWQAWPVKYVGV